MLFHGYGPSKKQRKKLLILQGLSLQKTKAPMIIQQTWTLPLYVRSFFLSLSPFLSLSFFPPFPIISPPIIIDTPSDDEWIFVLNRSGSISIWHLTGLSSSSGRLAPSPEPVFRSVCFPPSSLSFPFFSPSLLSLSPLPSFRVASLVKSLLLLFL